MGGEHLLQVSRFRATGVAHVGIKYCSIGGMQGHGENQPPARSQHSGQLAESESVIALVFNHIAGAYEVKAGIRNSSAVISSTTASPPATFSQATTVGLRSRMWVPFTAKRGRRPGSISKRCGESGHRPEINVQVLKRLGLVR